MASLHPAYRPQLREILAQAPNRWHDERAILRTLNSGSFSPGATAENMRIELRWNESKGFMETRKDEETEADQWRLTDAGRAAQGCA